MNQRKSHYYLITGRVVFSVDNSEPEAVLMSGTIHGQSKNISMKVLNAASNVLYTNFSDRVLNPEVQIDVQEVFVDNIIYLGHMTEDEFNDMPMSTGPGN